MNSLQEQIADNICRTRNAKKISVAQLAKTVGKTRAWVYQIESGGVTIGAHTIEEIARALKVHPDVLTHTGTLVGR